MVFVYSTVHQSSISLSSSTGRLAAETGVLLLEQNDSYYVIIELSSVNALVPIIIPAVVTTKYANSNKAYAYN